MKFISNCDNSLKKFKKNEHALCKSEIFNHSGRVLNYSLPPKPRPTIQPHHAMVEPLRDEVVQQFGVDQLSVIKVQTPEGEHHKLQTQKSAFRTAAIQTNKLAALQSRTERCIQEQWENCPFESKKYNGSHNSYSAKHHS